MPPVPPDYESIERGECQKERKAVQGEVLRQTARLWKRITTYVSRFGYNKGSVVQKIKNDDMFAAHFAKEPRRTGLHENVAAEWIKAQPGVRHFRVLPKSGPNAVKITSDGNIETDTAGKKPSRKVS